MFLISKDSNNRLEIEAPASLDDLADSPITAAGGGTLACHAGPTPTKSLAHPAVIDFALARYLQRSVAAGGEEALSAPFDPVLGRSVIDEALDRSDPVRTLTFFQNVVAASRGSITYPFTADPIYTWPRPEDQPDLADEEMSFYDMTGHAALQMVNRVFVVRRGTEGERSLFTAGAWKVNAAMEALRVERGESRVKRRESIPNEILRHHGWAADAYSARAGGLGLTVVPSGQDITIRRVNGVDPTWSVIVCNDDLSTLPPQRLQDMIDVLDLETYVGMLGETYTNNWCNQC